MNTNPISNPFNTYNNYYDLLYHDKNYQKEAEYITNLIKAINPEATELIDLGSGTGNYSKFLCEAGFKITGIERNKQMAAAANSKSIDGFHTVVDDISTFEVPRKFDAAISLFHVINYLTENEKILSCFSQVFKHLKPNGIFVFDVWYSPAVYLQLPQTRVKHVQDEKIDVTRLARPIMNYEKNIIEVHYEMTIKNKCDGQEKILEEVHHLRHFSTPEIELLAKFSGFKLIRSEEFLTAKVPGADTWGVCYILQKHD
jgi:SAM-dependent methyltransferase